MRISIIGFSGCGKSTLAHRLGECLRAEVLHLDSVHFLPGWAERDREEEQQIVESFLNSHDAWIIDGNYTKLSYERRMEEADEIIIMLFNRFDCLLRVIRRYGKYRNETRPDMVEGCVEKLDGEFVAWVLWKGRKKSVRDRYKRLQEAYPNKITVLRNQKQLNAFLNAYPCLHAKP